jgi:hypothetical protein
MASPSGVFDLMVIVALTDGWIPFASSLSRFQQLFPGLQPSVTAGWHAALAPGGSADGVEFRAAFAPNKMTPPCVITHYTGTPVEDVPLDYFIGATTPDGTTPQEEIGFLELETVTLYVITDNPEITRALAAAVKMILIANRQFLTDLGYEGLVYKGSGDLRPHEAAMFPEGVGESTRSLTFETTAQPSIIMTPQHLITASSILVASSDVDVDGIDGGVTAEE